MASKSEKQAWEEQAHGALFYRALGSREERWRKYISLMAHKWYEDDSPLAEDAPIINLVAARARSVAPKLAMGNPEWLVRSVYKPPTPNSEPALAALLATMWRAERCRGEMKRITDDFALFGQGIGFVGYERDMKQHVVDRRRSLLGILPVEPGTAVEKIADFLPNLTTEQVEAVRVMLAHHVFLKRVSPLDFAPDPTATSMADAAYVQRRLFLTPTEAEGLLGNKSPEPDSVANVAFYDTIDPDDPTANKENQEIIDGLPEAVKRVVVWELWDAVKGKTVYLNRDLKYLADFEWKSAHPGFPTVTMEWDEVPDVVYPEGLGAAIEPPNRDLHILRKSILAQAKRGMGKYRASYDLSRDARDALESEDDGAIVYLEEGQYAEPLEFSSFAGDLVAAEERMVDTIDQVSQTSAYDTGQPIPGKKTATESAFIQATSDAMTSYRQGQIEQFVSDVGERMIAALVTAFDQPIPLQIKNQDPFLSIMDVTPNGSPTERPAEREELIEYFFVPTEHIGLYTVSIEPGSLVAQAKDMERQNYLSVWDRFAAQPWFDSKKFAAQILATMPGIRNPSEFIISDEEAMAQQAQEQAIAPEQTAPQSPQSIGGGMDVFSGLSGPPPEATNLPTAAGGLTLPGEGPSTEGELLAAFRGANAPGVPL